MVNREHLRQGGLRAYELGRLRSAVRASWVLVPVALLCALETGAAETCVCVGTLLLAASVFFRWRSRRGTESVKAGLFAGSLPLVAGLVVARIAPNCAGAPVLSMCTAVCLAIGLPAGIWLGAGTTRGVTTAPHLLAAAGIAALAGSLGCVGLGAAGIVGTALGLFVGSASGALAATWRAV